jgi:hypothetical protein
MLLDKLLYTKKRGQKKEIERETEKNKINKTLKKKFKHTLYLLFPMPTLTPWWKKGVRAGREINQTYGNYGSENLLVIVKETRILRTTGVGRYVGKEVMLILSDLIRILLPFFKGLLTTGKSILSEEVTAKNKGPW